MSRGLNEKAKKESELINLAKENAKQKYAISEVVFL